MRLATITHKTCDRAAVIRVRRHVNWRPRPEAPTAPCELNPATVNALPAVIKHDVFSAIAHAVQSVFI